MKFILVLLLIFSLSALADSDLNSYEEKLSWIETANVESDFKKAIEKNDYRIKCVLGYALECPGIKNREGLSYSVIKSTGDVITSDRHEKLLDMVREYARTYNKLLLELKSFENAQ